MYAPDQAQQKALASWYKENNPLRLEPRHPLIALAGEAGELLDCFKKEEYKPNWSWWNCAKCKHTKDEHNHTDEYYCTGLVTEDKGYANGVEVFDCDCSNYVPIIIDELGDWSFYIRILTYQQSINFEMLCDGYTPFTACLEELLNDLAYRSVKLHKLWLKTQKVNPFELQILTFIFLTILERLEVSLEEILDLNYKKLNSEETQHGWGAAR